MPREHVVGNNPRFREDFTTEGNDPGDWQIEVGWQKDGTGPIDGSVQIATTDPNAELGSKESGLWIDLSRDKINELIRLLRKARDQAYGRDE